MSVTTPDVINVTKLSPGTIRILSGSGGTTVVEMSCHLSAGEFATDKSQDDPIPVLCGSRVASAADYSASISGTLLLDLADPDSIFYFSQSHKGEQAFLEYVPNTNVGLSISGFVTMDPLGITGDIGANATADFEWAFTEYPAILPPAAGTSTGTDASSAPTVTGP